MKKKTKIGAALLLPLILGTSYLVQAYGFAPTREQSYARIYQGIINQRYGLGSGIDGNWAVRDQALFKLEHQVNGLPTDEEELMFSAPVNDLIKQRNSMGKDQTQQYEEAEVSYRENILKLEAYIRRTSELVIDKSMPIPVVRTKDGKLFE